MSLANYSISLALPQLTNNQVVVYIVKESEPGNLQSKTTKLNGEVMDWTSHEPIFNIKGNVTTLPIEIPPYSQFFISAAPTARKNSFLESLKTIFRETMPTGLVYRIHFS